MTHPGDESWLALLDGDAPDAAGLRGHLAGCEACRARLAALGEGEALSRRAGAALAGSGELPVPAGVEAKVLEAARRLAGERPPAPRRRRAWLVGAVALAAAAIAALRLGTPQREGREEGVALALALDGLVATASREGDRGEPAPTGALSAAAGEVRAGALRVARHEGCGAGEAARFGGTDAQGRLRVYLVRRAAGDEVHVFAESGGEVAALAARDGRLVAPRVLSREAAERALAPGACDRGR